jgi:hypothetical protein
LRDGGETERRIELVKAIFAAGVRDEVESVLDSVDPEVVADWSRSRGPMAGMYSGRQSVVDFFAEALDVWDQIEYFHDEFIPVGEDKLVRVGGIHAKGLGSGVEVRASGANLFEFRDGLLARVTLYQSKEEALAAAAEN